MGLFSWGMNGCLGGLRPAWENQGLSDLQLVRGLPPTLRRGWPVGLRVGRGLSDFLGPY